MSIEKEFLSRFTASYLSDYYKDLIQPSAKPGIDRINVKNFNKNLEYNCDLICRKVINGTYNFIPYKEILILKGRNKYPRSLSIPSIRDKIVLSIIKDLLNEQFKDLLHSEFVKKKIWNVSKEFSKGEYSSFIKIDMQNFFGSLDHHILKEKLEKKIRNPEFISLILSAISNRTISQNESKKNAVIHLVGVPQGLPISNVLADIYMMDFDNKHTKVESYSYFRYVDDILILCNKEEEETVFDNLNNELSKDLHLKPHPLGKDNHKTHIGSIEKGFSYLGYEFLLDKITVQKKSRWKLERTIESLFNEYSNTKTTFNTFLWKLNLKITGAIFKTNTYGWLFYYSQINDETLMFELDNFVQKMFNRYKLSKKLERSEVNLKRFCRTLNEIKYNKKQSHYIPDFDSISIGKKREILKTCNLYMKDYDDDKNLKYAFDRFITQNMKELEKDRESTS